jgi:uncharacterized protein YjbI with pentapeptide repeats
MRQLVPLYGWVLNNVNFTDAILTRVVLTSSDLTDSVIAGADFSDALIDTKQQQALCKYASAGLYKLNSLDP